MTKGLYVETQCGKNHEENFTIICEVVKLQGFSMRLFVGILRSRKKDEGFLQGEDCLVRFPPSLEKVVYKYSLQVAGEFFITARSKHADCL